MLIKKGWSAWQPFNCFKSLTTWVIRTALYIKCFKVLCLLSSMKSHNTCRMLAASISEAEDSAIAQSVRLTNFWSVNSCQWTEPTSGASNFKIFKSTGMIFSYSLFFSLISIHICIDIRVDLNIIEVSSPRRVLPFAAQPTAWSRWLDWADPTPEATRVAPAVHVAFHKEQTKGKTWENHISKEPHIRHIHVISIGKPPL